MSVPGGWVPPSASPVPTCAGLAECVWVSSKTASKGGGLSNSCPTLSPSHSCQAAKATSSSSWKMSWQPKAGEGHLALVRALLAPEGMWPKHYFLSCCWWAPRLSLSQSEENILSPWLQYSSLAERWPAVTEGTITTNCDSCYREGVNGLFGLQLGLQTFVKFCQIVYKETASIFASSETTNPLSAEHRLWLLVETPTPKPPVPGSLSRHCSVFTGNCQYFPSGVTPQHHCRAQETRLLNLGIYLIALVHFECL